MLKPLAEVLEPDARFHNLVVGNPPFDIRRMTLADHHGHIAAIELSVGVPTNIRDAFERARNAYLYAWFVYDLTPLAQSQGYAALEMALRDRLGAKPDGKRWGGIRALLAAAQARGLFDGLPLPGHVNEVHREAYIKHLVEIIRLFRNDLAHGSGYLNMPGATLEALNDCAGLINHIYGTS